MYKEFVMSLAWFKTKVLSFFGLFLVSFLLVGCGSSGGGGSSSSPKSSNNTMTGFTFQYDTIKYATIGAADVNITIKYSSNKPRPTVTHTGVDYSPQEAIDFTNTSRIYAITAEDGKVRNYNVTIRRGFEVSSVDGLTTAIDTINGDIKNKEKYFTILVQKDINLTGVNTRNITTDWAGNHIIIEKDNSALPNNITITGLTVEGINTVEFIGVKTAPATSTNNILTGFTFHDGVIKNATINGTNVDITIDYYSNYTTPIVTHNGSDYFPKEPIDFTNLPTPYTIRADDNTPKNYQVIVRRAITVSNEAELSNAIGNITEAIANNESYITILINNDINLTRANQRNITSAWKGKNIVFENNSNLSNVTVRGLTVEGDDTLGFVGVTIRGVIVAIAAGDWHSLTLDSNGKIWVTGDSDVGQLGLGNTNEQNLFQLVASGSISSAKVVSIAAGNWHSFAVTSDGKLWATGYNKDGQLGLGNNITQISFQPVMINSLALNATIVSVAAGWLHSLVLDSNGKIWATGYNNAGQLGLGNIINQKSFQPVTISNLTSGANIDSLAAGYAYSLALDSDGKLWATGQNYHGQLGLGDNTDRNSFQPVTISGVALNATIVSVATYGLHSLALDSNGKLWVAGENDDGALGLGNNTFRESEFQPVIISGLASDVKIVSIATGWKYSIALDSNGKLWATGNNLNGQLGLGNSGWGTDINSFQPVAINGLASDANITSISAGDGHSFILDSNGKLWATGSNSAGKSPESISGQLGLGDTIDRNVFTLVPF
jgi:alpha-tubulin suppressor-like RCC1 family protein